MRVVSICSVVLFIANSLFSAEPVSMSGESGVTIENKDFSSGSGGASITLDNCSDITITNCSFVLNSDIIGIELRDCENVEITGCYFESFRTGVYAISCSGGIEIHCNQFKNIAGTYPRGQIVQFNHCTGEGNRVNYNTSDHEFGTGDPEDLINMYGSYGTESDPIQIIGNQLRGGGPSSSGGGIMIGDDGGHDIRVEDNILVDVGQYGIGCPAGYNMTIKNNTIYGASKDWTNVGLYVGLQGEIDAGFDCVGETITVTGNKVNFKNSSGNQNDIWICSCCPGVNEYDNQRNASIDESILPQELSLYQDFCGGMGYSLSVDITGPDANSVISNDSSFSVSAEVDATNQIVDAELYINGILSDKEMSSAYVFDLDTLSTGDYTLAVKVYDSEGNTATGSVDIEVVDSDAVPVVFSAVRDAYIESGTGFNNSYIKVEPGVRTGYLGFDVTGLSGRGVESAVIEMECSGDGGQGNVRIYQGDSDNWSETGISENTKPGKGAETGSTDQVFTTGESYEFDVTEAVTGDGFYSFVIEMDSGGNDAWFSSKEGSQAPLLKVVESNNTLVNRRGDMVTEKRGFRINTVSDYVSFNRPLWCDAKLIVYDIRGREIREISLDSGIQRVGINREEMSYGVYMFSVVSKGQDLTGGKEILR